MTREELKNRVDAIIAKADDDEAAHSNEDSLHLDVIAEFAPDWVNQEINRLNQAGFSRWCA